MADAPWKAEDPARGARIRAERERVGWTRTQLAELAGSSRNTIESYELGKPFKQRANAERLARAFSWNYADLMGITDEEAAKPVAKPTPRSKARSRPGAPLTRGDIDALRARLDEVSASHAESQRDQFEQLAGRIDDVRAALETAVTELREDLDRLTIAQSSTGASLASLSSQVSALLAGLEDQAQPGTRATSRPATRATAKKRPSRG